MGIYLLSQQSSVARNMMSNPPVLTENCTWLQTAPEYTEGHGRIKPTQSHHRQKAESEVPKLDVLWLPAVPWEPTNKNHRQDWRRQKSLGEGQRQLETCWEYRHLDGWFKTGHPILSKWPHKRWGHMPSPKPKHMFTRLDGIVGGGGGTLF